MYTEEDIEEVVDFAVDLIFDKTGVRLNNLDKVVLRGALEGQTYREIQETQAEARSYEVDYISRYVAYELRKHLREALQAEGILKQGEKLRKKNLWEYLDEALKQRYLVKQAASRSSDVLGSEPPTKVLQSPESDNAPNDSKTAKSFRSSSQVGMEETTSKVANFLGRSGGSAKSSLYSRYSAPPANDVRETSTANPKQDWGEAPDVSIFYGRTEELAHIQQSIITDQCRVVALLGLGGIGKTTLSVRCSQQIQDEFEYVIWRNLRHAPPLLDLLEDLLKFLGDECPPLAKGTEERFLSAIVAHAISQLIKSLRSHRCLLIFDEWESVLASGELAGRYRRGYEAYGDLIKRLGQEYHQSCLVLTSREKPTEMALLEGESLKVKSFQVEGLKKVEAREILLTNRLHDQQYWEKLIELYRGNPLALIIICQNIKFWFNGSVSQFVERNTLAIDDALRGLLERQFERLSALEKEIMYWLAIARLPVSLTQMKQLILLSATESEFLEAVKSLAWRSLIEKKSKNERLYFTIQPSIMRYITKILIEQIVGEIIETIRTKNANGFELFRSHALITELEPDGEIQTIQMRLLVTPIRDKLIMLFKSDRRLAAYLNEILSMLEDRSSIEVGYATANLQYLLAPIPAVDS